MCRVCGGQEVVGFGVSKGFAEVRWWYRKVYAEVVDVAENLWENFSFFRVLRTSGILRLSGLRTSGGCRTSGAWAISGTG